MTTANRQLMEKLLDSKASAWAGSALVLPLLLLLIFLGTISYTVGQQTAPLIEKILTPPSAPREEEIDFEDLSAPNEDFQTTFEEFQQDKVDLFEIPQVEAEVDLPEIEPTREPAATQVALSETPDGSAAWSFDDPAANIPGVALSDPSVTMTTRDEPEKLDATLRRAAGSGPAKPVVDPGSAAKAGGAALGKDQSGDIQAEPGVEQAVVINRSERTAGQGVGLNKPASQEKLDLTGWILGHPRALPPAVADALDFSREKADRTSTGSVVDETGKLYQFFFLHRSQNNLLRILVVLGNQAYRIDLPDFYLEANHVQAGRVFRGPAPDDDPFAPGPVIEVALESVSEIPGEVPGMFQLVLDWLEIKGQE